MNRFRNFWIIPGSEWTHLKINGYERVHLFADLIWARLELFGHERKPDWVIVRTFSRYYRFLRNSKILVHYISNIAEAESVLLINKKSSMEQTNGPSTRQLLETRDDACTAVGRILDDHQSLFEMAPFAKDSTVNKLSSTCYKENFVICLENTLHSASRLLCRYAKNGGCLLEKAQ